MREVVLASVELMVIIGIGFMTVMAWADWRTTRTEEDLNYARICSAVLAGVTVGAAWAWW